MEASRNRVFTGAPWEKTVGYCRAIKVANQVFVSGTAPVADNGSVFAPGDPYRQAVRCFEIIKQALAELDCPLSKVVRTRMTDIVTGWTECEAIWAKSGLEVRKALRHMEKRLPFALKALYVDNGSEFLNEDIIEGFATKERKQKLPIYRGRPYRKNDQAYVEQKNYTHVRHLFGYGPISWQKSVGQVNNIYRKEWRILQNFFMPQQKLQSKVRIGSKIVRKMDKAKTPYERLKVFLTPSQLKPLEAEYEAANPFRCRKDQQIKTRQLFGYYQDNMTPLSEVEWLYEKQTPAQSNHDFW